MTIPLSSAGEQRTGMLVPAGPEFDAPPHWWPDPSRPNELGGAVVRRAVRTETGLEVWTVTDYPFPGWPLYRVRKTCKLHGDFMGYRFWPQYDDEPAEPYPCDECLDREQRERHDRERGKPQQPRTRQLALAPARARDPLTED